MKGGAATLAEALRLLEGSGVELLDVGCAAPTSTTSSSP